MRGAASRGGGRSTLPAVGATRDRPSKQLVELLHFKSSLPDDGPERAWFEVAAGMDGYGDGPRRVSGKDHHVMTADDPINQEPRASEGADNAPSVKRRQPAIGHSYAATVTRRISGGASVGIESP
jgi:hypothetical protein